MKDHLRALPGGRRGPVRLPRWAARTAGRLTITELAALRRRSAATLTSVPLGSPESRDADALRRAARAELDRRLGSRELPPPPRRAA